MAYAFDDDEIKFWWGTEEFPQEVIDHINTGGLITAHNSEFERHMFDHVLSRTHQVKPPHLYQWRCSMAMSLANGFAGGLDAAAAGVGLPYKKHTQGTRLIKEYCAPGHLTEFKDGDADLMEAYNIGDVEIMRALVKCLRPLTDDEWYEYHLNCRINERGLPIDVAFCEAALGYTREVADDANRQISELTGGMMTRSTQRNARNDWLFPRLTPEQMKLLEVYKKSEKKISLDADHRQYLLNCEDLDYDARHLLEYIDNAGSSALKKFAVAAHQHSEGRVHNTFLWNGAGRSGRFSGKGLQPHNFRRDVFDSSEAEALIQDVLEGYEIDAPADTMARLLRAMISSEEGLYWVDWSAIEGRVAPWLSNLDSGREKLKIFASGKDIYIYTAARMGGTSEADIDNNARQTGKVAELSLQFGGSHNALIGMGRNYGITFEEDVARDTVTDWCYANPWAQEIWAQYDLAIRGAVANHGEPFEVGRVTYQADNNFLWCRLPSGRLLAYPFPKWEPYTTPWGEERIGPTFQSHFKPKAGEPPIRLHARGPLLFQNSVQAVAADLLREALVEADCAGLKIVATVHDEIIGIGGQEDGDLLNEIMLEVPEWAEGLPIATGGVSVGRRYGK